MPSEYLARVWTDDHGFLSRVASVINRLLAGAHNEIHDVTLANNAATTRYPSGTDVLERITPSTVVLLMATHADALTLEHTSPYILAVPDVGHIDFAHAAIASANHTFKMILFGD